MPLVQRKPGARDRVGAAEREGLLEDRCVGLLLHEQRNVLECVVEVHAEAGAEDVIAAAGQVISQPDARAEPFAVVARLLCCQTGGQGTERRGRLQFLEGAAVGDIRASDEVEVFVPAQAGIDGQAMGDLPVILEVQSELLRVFDEERRIAHRDAHAVSSIVAGEQPRSLKSLWQGQDLAGQLAVVKLQRRVGLEKAAHQRCKDIVKTSLEGVLAHGLGYVILELVLTLNRVLRNIGVSPELDGARAPRVRRYLLSHWARAPSNS